MSNLSLLTQLADCLEAARSAASRYDSGDTRAASDIAKALCSMFEDGFQAPSLMTQLSLPELTLLSTCPQLPSGVTSSSQALSHTDARTLVARPRFDEHLNSARQVPWREWWDEETVYATPYEPVTRACLVAGASHWYGGFRIAIPFKTNAELEFVPLLVAGEDEEWAPSLTQLADVRQVMHELIGSPAFAALLR